MSTSEQPFERQYWKFFLDSSEQSYFEMGGQRTPVIFLGIGSRRRLSTIETLIRFRISNPAVQVEVGGTRLRLNNKLVQGRVMGWSLDVSATPPRHDISLQIPAIAHATQVRVVPSQARSLREVSITVDWQEWESEQSEPYDFVELLLQSLERDRYEELKQPAICRGCIHYHGQVYVGGKGVNWLCCGLHPNGPTGEQCGDREPAP
ncbi:hypothetical protein ACQ4M4_26030 [Leptolyngbya sp. AN02str]|uniref:hypothetical protein n=1 Tax=Leptolyngbya sp. AN02str TaxID=3423363 RepID=UPI003D3132BB